MMLLDVETVYVFICFSSTSVSSDLKALYKSVIIIIIIIINCIQELKQENKYIYYA